ncbi:MAG TPA: flagellar hook capping FlgD N-terminal domain-containing protein [Candidatus Atribacteria bacterium]|nr:flagellar hook capping FlgD N-terminal domain-containing protein [Candidatus Atribacteria bacterium]HPT78042.1 flagellar hook capping FlgD N-terminal domain-containing protein [Candidatus Atribacteria bacterium]
MKVYGVQAATIADEVERTPKNQLGKNDFMQILAAQIKYQNPLSGSDQTQNIAQLAQLSALEQMQNLNNTLLKLLLYQNVQYGSQLVGKHVVLRGPDRLIQGQVQKVNIQDGYVRILVNDVYYDLEQVAEIVNTEVNDWL